MIINSKSSVGSVSFISFSYLVGVEEKQTSDQGNVTFINKSKSTSTSTSQSPAHQCYNKILSHIAYTNLVHTVTGDRIHKLSYTGQDCHHIPDALGKLYGQKVQILDLSFNSLYNLKGLNGFQTLQELILDNNELNDNIQFPFLPYLHTLSLNKNNITNLEQLIEQIYEKLPQLTYLSLLGNKACPDQLTDIEKDENDYQRYRYYVLYKLPKLNFLDSTRVTEEERSEALRRGKFMKVVRPTNTSSKSNKNDNDLEAIEKNYTPLSAANLRSSDEHRGAYGKCRYRYSGKHSEGNRFIKNNDL